MHCTHGSWADLQNIKRERNETRKHSNQALHCGSRELLPQQSAVRVQENIPRRLRRLVLLVLAVVERDAFRELSDSGMGLAAPSQQTSPHTRSGRYVGGLRERSTDGDSSDQPNEPEVAFTVVFLVRPRHNGLHDTCRDCE